MTVTELYESVWDGVQLSAGYILDPNKRIYYAFLVTSVVLAFGVFRTSKIKGSFLHYIFNPRVWWGDSPKVDYAFLIFNGLVKVIAIAPMLVLGLYLSFYTKEFLLSKLGYPELQISSFWIVFFYTSTLFVVKDLSSYVVHWLFHKVPWLWKFHKVHHSATVLNPITQYRIHPFELIVNNLKGLFVFGLVTGCFDYLSNGQFSVFSILGVNVFGFVFMALGANLRHSHVKLEYPSWMESWVISPLQHQVHHSDNPDHYDSNLGSVLSIWDRVFGTLIKSREVTKIKFGLGKKENPRYRGFWQNLFP